ncbi:MAG: hypothetical protein LBF08_04570, partial [Dysgonamonadaceae bacterium]|nr:hypothetical protein [Dysgonamonadaceae bacterium]
MKRLIPFISILFITATAKSDNYLYGHGRHMIVNEHYPNGTTYTVTPNNGIVNIQLEDTYINLRGYNPPGIEKDAKPCIDIQEGNQVRIILRGTSELWGGFCCPAIRVHPKSQLFIDGRNAAEGGEADGGTLIAHGGPYNHMSMYYPGGGWEKRGYIIAGGSGIGGGWDYAKADNWPSNYDKYYTWNFEIPHGMDASDLPYMPDEYVATDWSGIRTIWSKGYGACGDIIILGGTVEAYGGGFAPGIGPAGNYTKGGRIEIAGGNVYAKGGMQASGIGCAAESYVYGIKVSGGNVTAEGGGGDGSTSAPGIGGAGPHSYIEHINLEGGNITARAKNKNAVGIGAGRDSKINHINIWSGATVTAESNRERIPAIGALDGSAIEHIQIFGGNVTAKNGIGKAGDVTNLVISRIYLHSGAKIDVSAGGVQRGSSTGGGGWKTYPDNIANAGDLFNHKLPTLGVVDNTQLITEPGVAINPPAHLLYPPGDHPLYPDGFFDNVPHMDLPDGRKITEYYMLQFIDPNITHVRGLTFKVGDDVHAPLAGDSHTLFDNKVYPLYFFSSPQTGAVTVYRNDTLIYKETGRVTRRNHHAITLRKLSRVGFDLTGTVTAVNRKIRYQGELHPNYSRIVDGDDDITFLVHGADTGDVPKYYYTWYKADSVVDKGLNKHTYTVDRRVGEDVSGYSVRLEPVGDFTFTLNNNVQKSFTGLDTFQTVGNRYYYKPASSRNLRVEVETGERVAYQAATFYNWNISGLVNGTSEEQTFVYGSTDSIFSNTFVDEITALSVRSLPLVRFNLNSDALLSGISYTGKVLRNNLVDGSDFLLINQPIVPGDTVTIKTDYGGERIFANYRGEPINLPTNCSYYVVSPSENVDFAHDNNANDLGNHIPGDIRLLGSNNRRFVFTAPEEIDGNAVTEYYWTYTDAAGVHNDTTTDNTLILENYNLHSALEVRVVGYSFTYTLNVVKSGFAADSVQVRTYIRKNGADSLVNNTDTLLPGGQVVIKCAGGQLRRYAITVNNIPVTINSNTETEYVVGDFHQPVNATVRIELSPRTDVAGYRYKTAAGAVVDITGDTTSVPINVKAIKLYPVASPE